MNPSPLQFGIPLSTRSFCYSGFLNLNMFQTAQHSIFFWSGLLLVIPGALLAPTKRAECADPVIRREWNTLSQSQQASFHAAVKCLQNKTSVLDTNGVSKSLFDDYTYIHLQSEPIGMQAKLMSVNLI
jgi:hypothetical protein